jgi:AAA ATPase domain
MATSSEPATQSPRNAADRLVLKLRTAWQDLRSCTDGAAQAAAVGKQAPADLQNLQDMRAWYEETSRQLLMAPLERFLKLQPIKSALDALSMRDPEISTRALNARSRIDRKLQRILIATALDLPELWRIFRVGNNVAESQSWQKRREAHNKEASVVLDHYARWAQKAIGEEKKREEASRDPRNDLWWRQHRALLETLQVEMAWRNLTLTWFSASETLIGDVHRESEEARSYKAATLRWLEEGAPLDLAQDSSFALITPEERLRGWALPIESEARLKLAERTELLVGGLRPRLRRIAIHSRFLRAFDTYARKRMRGLIEHSWQMTARVVRDAEQSKEIITYWGETSLNRPGDASQLIEEARQNATISLVEEFTLVPVEELNREAVEAFWRWHQAGSLMLEANQDGWFAFLRRPRARSFLPTAAEMLRLQSRTALLRGVQWVRSRVERTMESVGGRVPAHPVLPPVIRRTTLRDTLALPAAKRELPPLYRLLFRLAPVEDRRFLVGRDQELAGIDQAVTDWEAGRFAACLLIGARGSGKTSLLNCAVRETLADHRLIRSEFNDRLLRPEQLDAFLRSLLGLRDDADLLEGLASERRILILEEGERIFVRTVDGFAVVHHLMHLIHRTAATTLWLIVMNDRSFRMLDAATYLHRVFSHRINAMSVSRSDLETAILERHRLSGLRLEFAPPPAGDPRVNRAKRWVGIEDSPQTLFFDSLLQQSEGIFRSAFELWLSSIERVEGDTIHIRQPLDPSFNLFRSELAQEDHFTLLVIQEHGSLTQEELAEVLCESQDKSRGRTERLTALGLIELDPEHPGLRVKPEAQRFVNDLLRRANLT